MSRLLKCKNINYNTCIYCKIRDENVMNPLINTYIAFSHKFCNVHVEINLKLNIFITKPHMNWKYITVPRIVMVRKQPTFKIT